MFITKALRLPVFFLLSFFGFAHTSAAHDPPISLRFKTNSRGIVVDCVDGLKVVLSANTVSRSGMTLLKKVYADKHGLEGQTVDKNFMSNIANVFTDEEWIKFSKILDTMEDSRCVGSASVLLDSGKCVVVNNYDKKILLEMLPQLRAFAQTLGMTSDQLFKILWAFVQTRSEYVGFETSGRYFLMMFEEASKGPVKFNLLQVDQLVSLVKLSKKEGLLENALYNIGFLLRLGLRPDQINDVFLELFKGNRVYAGLEAFQRLQALTKLLIDFSADPNQVYSTLKGLFQHIEKHWTRFSEFLDYTISEIERRAVTEGKSINDILYELQVVVEGDAKAIRRLIPSDTELALAPLEIPKVRRKLRPSAFSYKTEWSYEEGLRHLGELAKDETMVDEGIFVFDPDTNFWYSLASHTEILHDEGRVRTYFENFDLSNFGKRPKFVHIHPKSLTRNLLPSREFTDKYRYLMARFSTTMPSQADLVVFATLMTQASKPINPEFAIVHDFGVTVIRIDPRSLSTFEQFTNSFFGWKETVMREFLNDVEDLDSKKLADEEHLIRLLWQRVQDRLN
jgi:hypothetical protein